jgi:hypothetical protein
MSELERGKYPGMRSTEVVVWRRWLALHESEYEHYDYNVRLGVGRDPGAAFTEPIRKSAIMSSQLRADVIAWQGGVPTIIEVKKSAWAYAVQQVQQYGAVYVLEHPGIAAPHLLIVTGRVMEGTSETAANANVALVTV